MSQSHEGKRVPNVTFRTRVGNEWRNISSEEIFNGQTVVVFSLPGAFTPTCSSTHVPGYNELAPAFRANGVDRIVCVSVNDAFVMNEWAANQGADNVLFLPDGSIRQLSWFERLLVALHLTSAKELEARYFKPAS